MSTPPTRAHLADTYPNPNGGVFRTAIGAFWDYVTALMGSDGTAASARVALAIPAPGRNKIVNGAMTVSDYNDNSAVTPVTGSVYIINQYTVAASQSSKLTFQRVTDAPNGFKNSLKITVASQFSPGAADYFSLNQAMEGCNVVDWQLGASGAVVISTSQYIKGSVAGNYAVTICNSAVNRSWTAVVAVTTSWQRLAFTITGDTAGTWLNSEVTVGLYWILDLGCGSNYNTSGGAWTGSDKRRTSGAVTFVNQTAGATLNITGVQVEKDGLTDYEHKKLAQDQRECFRYLPVFRPTGATGYLGVGIARNTTHASITLPFREPAMRQVTNVVTTTIGNFSLQNLAGASPACTGAAFLNADWGGIDQAMVDFTVASGLTAAMPYALATASTSKIYLTGAEL